MEIDVAIIGASSSGLYAAEKLAHAGKRVRVFEQRESLCPARRTLIVTPHFQNVLAGVNPAVVLHHTRTLRVVTPRETVQVELQEPDLIIDRRELIEHLARRAEASGAEICYGVRFQGLEPSSDGARVHFQTPLSAPTAVTAGVVIGADGVPSDVARAVGIAAAPTAPILQAEVLLPKGWDSSVTQVWFDCEDTRFFYWLIPESAERGVVGLVGDDSSEIRALLDRFLARNGLTSLAYQGARIALHHPRLRVSAQLGRTAVHLIGDAAGQVKVTTVGGTVSGLLGASAVVRSILNGTAYHSELAALKRELDLHWWIRFFLDRLDNAGYDRIARAVTPQVREFLSEHNRDEMFGPIWQLPLLQPRLMAIGLGGLLARQFPALGARPGALPSAE